MKNPANVDHEVKHPMTVADYAVMAAASLAMLAMALRAGLQGSGFGVFGLWMAAALVPAAVVMPKIRFGRLILVADAWLAGASALAMVLHT